MKIVVSGTSVDATWSAQRDDVAVLEKASDGDTAGYLSQHITVRQDGHPCRMASAAGLRLRFVCPRQVTRIQLTVTALTDVDPVYRTLSVTDTGGGGLHTAKEPTRTLATTSAAAVTRTPPGGGVWVTDLPALLDHGATLPLALLVSAAVGALHACAPGHGKSLAAGYLVGARGRPRDAVWLGAIVAVMHTFSVAALAVGWWMAASSTPDMAALTGWLQLAAALVVAGVGVGLLRRHLRHRHHHAHGHGHGHGHGHSHGHHIPDAPSLLTWRGLVLLGTSGGLLPSPSAFLVLLTGLLTGKVAMALAMVAAFGSGMALTLIGVGVAVLRGRDALLDRWSRSPGLRTWSLRMPVFAAAGVVAAGTVASAVAAGALMAR
ncbi:hypothetical protein ACF09C_31280 [Streptomyces sp. NPDC014870]|uniref:hypothetical protein n=1 Tax=Streptomyces sp. NPDC014870 TaxID=3364925 RepID=UPI0036FFEC66